MNVLLKWFNTNTRKIFMCSFNPKPVFRGNMKYLVGIWVFLLTASWQVSAKTIGLKVVNTSGVEGTYINLPVNADTSLTGEGVIAFELSFTYNASYVTFDTVYTVGSLTSAWNNFTLDKSVSGKVRIIAANASVLSGSGVLFYLRFYGKTSGSSGVSFNAGECLLNEGTPALKLTNGTIQVTAKPSITVSPNTGVITVGDKLQFNASGGTSPYTWAVTNSSVASISSNGQLTATAKGFTKVVATDNTGIKDTSNQDIEIRGLKLYFRDTAVFEGHTLILPVYTTNINALGINSGTFTVSFNPNLSISGIQKTGSILSVVSDVQYNTTPGSGLCTVSFAHSSALSGSGILCFLKVESVVGLSNTGSFNFTDILFNEDILANKTSGYVQIKTLPSLTISPNITTLQVNATQQFTASNGTGPYTYSVSDATLASIATDGTLTALKSGKVKVLAEDIYGAKGSSAFIDLVAAHLSVHDTTGVKNQVLQIPVWLEKHISGNDLFSFQFDIQIDTTKLIFSGIETTGTLSQNWSVAGNRVGNILKIAGAGAQVIIGNGAIVFLKLQVQNTMVQNQTTQLQLINIVLNEGIPIATSKNGNLQNTSPTAVSQLTESGKLRLWPNPSNGNFTLQLQEEKIGTVEVISLQGRVVEVIKKVLPGKNSISLDLPEGQYILKVQTADGKSSFEKLLITR